MYYNIFSKSLFVKIVIINGRIENGSIYCKMDIREIENIIDIEHKNSPVFNMGKEQTMYDLLTSFEDTCGLIQCGAILLARVLKKIRMRWPVSSILTGLSV